MLPEISQLARVVKYPPAKAGDIRDAGSVPGMERSPGEGDSNSLQHSCLEAPTWTEEPGGLHFIGSHRVGHSWRNLARMHALTLITEMCTLKSTQILRVLIDEPSQSDSPVWSYAGLLFSITTVRNSGLFIFSAAFYSIVWIYRNVLN